MKKYRILEVEFYEGKKLYKAQKRVLGFLWITLATFSTQKSCEEVIEYEMCKPKKRIVKTY